MPSCCASMPGACAKDPSAPSPDSTALSCERDDVDGVATGSSQVGPCKPPCRHHGARMGNPNLRSGVPAWDCWCADRHRGASLQDTRQVVRLRPVDPQRTAPRLVRLVSLGQLGHVRRLGALPHLSGLSHRGTAARSGRRGMTRFHATSALGQQGQGHGVALGGGDAGRDGECGLAKAVSSAAERCGGLDSSCRLRVISPLARTGERSAICRREKS